MSYTIKLCAFNFKTLKEEYDLIQTLAAPGLRLVYGGRPNDFEKLRVH